MGVASPVWEVRERDTADRIACHPCLACPVCQKGTPSLNCLQLLQLSWCLRASIADSSYLVTQRSLWRTSGKSQWT